MQNFFMFTLNAGSDCLKLNVICCCLFFPFFYSFRLLFNAALHEISARWKKKRQWPQFWADQENQLSHWIRKAIIHGEQCISCLAAKQLQIVLAFSCRGMSHTPHICCVADILCTRSSSKGHKREFILILANNIFFLFLLFFHRSRNLYLRLHEFGRWSAHFLCGNLFFVYVFTGLCRHIVMFPYIVLLYWLHATREPSI